VTLSNASVQTFFVRMFLRIASASFGLFQKSACCVI